MDGPDAVEAEGCVSVDARAASMGRSVASMRRASTATCNLMSFSSGERATDRVAGQALALSGLP